MMPERENAVSEFGAADKPVLSESQTGETCDGMRSQFQQNINGRVIRADRVDNHVFVTLDGTPFAGSFIEALQAAAKMPVRWDGMFE
jgi:hypothetical protein